jgi:hypothetical protein
MSVARVLALFLLLVFGSAAGQSLVAQSATKGSWTAPFPWPHVAIHMNLLPNGKVLTWEREDPGSAFGQGIAPAAVWNSTNGSFTNVTYANVDLFCAGHSFLPDGKLFVTGGHYKDHFGAEETSIFDYATNSWSAGPDMNAGRWYPTNTTLANGEVLIVSGDMTGNNTPDPLPQVRRTSGSLRNLTGALLEMPLYPRMHLAPDGRVFNSGPLKQTRFLNTSGTGSWQSGRLAKWGYRSYGSSVMYDVGKILIVGGGNPPTNTAEIIDLKASNPAWKFTGAMQYKRRQMNATLLADGKVLATGGSSSNAFSDANGAVLAAEIWNPSTGTWTAGASMQIPRLYHSTAVLLPDGRVLSAGSGQPASDHDIDRLNGEIYSPPYLFNSNGTLATRPVISSAPASTGYGQVFFVGTAQATQISKVSWIRIGSVTHSFNTDQRFLPLSFTKVSGGLNVTAPANANLSPPGYYMLFILNGSGVPSVARFMRIG